MNLKQSIDRASEAIRQLILRESIVRTRHEQGEELEEILSSTEWALLWLKSADQAQIEILTRILIGYAATPFELEDLMKTEVERCALSGAEIRVAVARLRRSGILFAIRKSWGEQLIYLPTDTVAVWQPLLCGITCEPLAEDEMKEITVLAKDFRLPLSLELLIAWYMIYRKPISFTAKGALHRPTITNIVAQMHLTQEEINSLSLSYPHMEQVPAQVALVLDIGLFYDILHIQGNELCISDNGLDKWLELYPKEADLRLHELIMTRYSSVNPTLHLIASVVHSLPTRQWFKESDIQIKGNQLGKIDQWLGLMESFGWVARGEYKEQAIFRKSDRLEPMLSVITEADKSIIVQPDGEIFVPPDTGLAQRWTLEEIAERVTADHLFVYRLTQNSCNKAYHSGHSLHSVTAFLEQNSGAKVPEVCTRALKDWFAPLGKVNFTQVMLLRAASLEVANALLADPLTTEYLLERVGDTDFIVEAASLKLLRANLIKIGFPPHDRSPIVTSANAPALASAKVEVRDRSGVVEQGWIYRRHMLSVYEPDRTIPNKEQLFPGMSSIPASWITQPRTYHATTRKEIIQRAIDWQVAVLIGQEHKQLSFTPARLEEDNTRWRVYGQWQSDQSMVVIHADEISEIMILLPSLEEMESI